MSLLCACWPYACLRMTAGLMHVALLSGQADLPMFRSFVLLFLIRNVVQHFGTSYNSPQTDTPIEGYGNSITDPAQTCRVKENLKIWMNLIFKIFLVYHIIEYSYGPSHYKYSVGTIFWLCGQLWNGPDAQIGPISAFSGWLPLKAGNWFQKQILNDKVSVSTVFFMLEILIKKKYLKKLFPFQFVVILTWEYIYFILSIRFYSISKHPKNPLFASGFDSFSRFNTLYSYLLVDSGEFRNFQVN